MCVCICEIQTECYCLILELRAPFFGRRHRRRRCRRRRNRLSFFIFDKITKYTLFIRDQLHMNNNYEAFHSKWLLVSFDREKMFFFNSSKNPTYFDAPTLIPWNYAPLWATDAFRTSNFHITNFMITKITNIPWSCVLSLRGLNHLIFAWNVNIFFVLINILLCLIYVESVWADRLKLAYTIYVLFNVKLHISSYKALK